MTALALFSFITILIHISSGQETPLFHSFVPDRVPNYGGIQLEVQGMLFSWERSACCRFGNVTVPAKVSTSLSLSCVIPPVVDDVYNVSLEISNDGYQFSNSGFHFLYYGVFSVSPTSGDIVGSTLVTVYGVNFQDKFACKFGEDVVPTQLIDYSTLTCVSPRGSPDLRKVVLEVGVPYIGYTYDGAQFTYTGELPPDEDTNQYLLPVLILSVSGIIFVALGLVLLGLYVTKPKYIALEPVEGQGLLN